MEEISTSWHTYPSLFALGHRALNELLLDPVIVEEKIDGSQLSFGKFGDTIRVRSRGKEFPIDAPEKMFALACEVIQTLPLTEGYTYRGEYLSKPKHNTLAYDRPPKNHIIIFDINPGHEQYLSYEAKRIEAERLGLECVPLLFSGVLDERQQLVEMLDRVSVLGGQKIEGVVIKNYNRFGPDKKVLIGKFVSEAFKEVHRKDWKERTPGAGDILQALINSYRTPARWNKAVQHLVEGGTLDNSPKDIGPLIKEVSADVQKECADDIKDQLFKWAWPKVSRGITGGLPEWYKEKLMGEQFGEVAK